VASRSSEVNFTKNYTLLFFTITTTIITITITITISIIIIITAPPLSKLSAYAGVSLGMAL